LKKSLAVYHVSILEPHSERLRLELPRAFKSFKVARRFARANVRARGIGVTAWIYDKPLGTSSPFVGYRKAHTSVVRIVKDAKRLAVATGQKGNPRGSRIPGGHTRTSHGQAEGNTHGGA